MIPTDDHENSGIGISLRWKQNQFWSILKHHETLTLHILVFIANSKDNLV